MVDKREDVLFKKKNQKDFCPFGGGVAIVVPLVALGVVAVVLYVAWPRRRNTVPWEGTTHSPEEAARVEAELRDALSRALFGDALAGAVWDKVRLAEPFDGAIPHRHRDYCGHGLVRSPEGVMLVEVQDAGAFFSPALAEWTDRDAFVAFLARQSDCSCSGWDPDEPVMHTDDEWRRNNQRLTHAALVNFVGAA